MNVYVYGQDDCKTVDPNTFVVDFKRSLTAKPWEYELLLDGKLLPIEQTLVEAGVLHESTLVLHRREVNEKLQAIVSSSTGANRCLRLCACCGKPAIIYSFIGKNFMCGYCEIGVLMDYFHGSEELQQTKLRELQDEEAALQQQIQNNRECQDKTRKLLEELPTIKDFTKQISLNKDTINVDTINVDTVRELQSWARENLH